MNKILTTTALMALAATATVTAQDSRTSYNFLRLPVSAHAAALGGDNVSLISDDPSLMTHNPALLSSVSDRQIALHFMTYMEGTVNAGASFNRTVGERASWAVAAQYLDYGKMKHTDAENNVLGEFSAKDIAVSGYFAYLLGERIAGGICAKLLTSNIGDYNSIAMGVDLGVNYYNPDNELSVSLTAKNLGGQLKAFEEDYEALPIDLQAGVSKKMTHTPFTVSATLTDLNHWNYKFINHLTIGLNADLSQAVWIGAGYNFRRADDMTIDDPDGGSSHGAGLSFGAGVNISRLKINVAYGKYHVSSSSLLINAAFNI